MPAPARPDPGLCPSCRHGRSVPARASSFWLCERSRSDPAFPRYPRLPVVECRGYEAAPADDEHE